MNIVVKKLNTPISVLWRSSRSFFNQWKKIETKGSPWQMNLFEKPSLSKIAPRIGAFMGTKKIVYYCSSKFEGPKYRQKTKMPVHEFLDAHHISYLESLTTYRIKYCPFCTKPHHDEPTNLHVLNVHKENGYYHCFRCSSSGTWLEFRQKILGFDTDFSASDFLSKNKPGQPSQQSNQRISEAQYFIYQENLYKKSFENVLQYVKSRGFTEETIKKFNIGAGVEDFYGEDGNIQSIQLVYFPLYTLKKKETLKAEIIQQTLRTDTTDKNFYFSNDWSQIVKIKMRGASKETKKFMRQYPIGNMRGIFGLNTIKDTDKVVVLTQGQFDAMAVHQQTGYPSVSLPQGASNLPETLLTIFDRFDKIILWMDNDEAGQLNRQKIAEKLGQKRTCIVKLQSKEMKDANDVLRRAPQMMKDLLQNSRTIPESNLTFFSKIRDNVKRKLQNQESQQGTKIRWLPFFNQKVKGLRLGQLSIISGPTGSGKTTFLSQLFLDVCERDLGVLWGSFEIRNEILITHMLNQFANINMAKNIEKFDYYAEQFDKLPLFLMNFYGSTTKEKILSTIIYTIQKHNIQMIVLDTLQFMLSEQGEGFKKFEIQDSLMAKLRQISIRFNVHIAIVIHPRKTDEGEDIGIHSIYGTSKATQEADNIWVIQNRDGFKILDIKKNRYDGELGKIPLGFNRQTKRFFQLKRVEFEAIRTKEMTMKEVIKAREEEYALNNPVSDQEFHFFEEQIKDHQLTKEPKTYSSKYSKH